MRRAACFVTFNSPTRTLLRSSTDKSVHRHASSSCTPGLDKKWNFASAKPAFLERVSQLKPFIIRQRNKPSTNTLPTTPPTTYGTLVPLCLYQDTPCILFTLRSSHLYKHRGEISFPGGRSDDHDENITDTALRETEEEIGLSRSRIEIWTSLPALATRDAAGTMTATVGFCGTLTDTDLHPNPTEVEEIFLCSIAHLLKNNGSTSFRNRLRMPVFRTGKELEWRNIWGMTAITTEMVLHCLIPDAYPRLLLAPTPKIRTS